MFILWNLNNIFRNYLDIYNLSDEVLCSLLNKGDEKAFETIYKNYWRKLYGFVFSQIGNKEDTEEILADLFLSIWNKRFDHKINNLRIYLFVSSRNLINRALRNKLNFEKYREFELLQKVFQTTEMEQIVDSVEFFKRLDTILAKMPEKTAVIFRLSKIDESPVKKIAEELQMSEKAVEYHITKSLKIMRKNFKNYYSEN